MNVTQAHYWGGTAITTINTYNIELRPRLEQNNNTPGSLTGQDPYTFGFPHGPGQNNITPGQDTYNNNTSGLSH